MTRLSPVLMRQYPVAADPQPCSEVLPEASEGGQQRLRTTPSPKATGTHPSPHHQSLCHLTIFRATTSHSTHFRCTFLAKQQNKGHVWHRKSCRNPRYCTKFPVHFTITLSDKLLRFNAQPGCGSRDARKRRSITMDPPSGRSCTGETTEPLSPHAAAAAAREALQAPPLAVFRTQRQPNLLAPVKRAVHAAVQCVGAVSDSAERENVETGSGSNSADAPNCVQVCASICQVPLSNYQFAPTTWSLSST